MSSVTYSDQTTRSVEITPDSISLRDGANSNTIDLSPGTTGVFSFYLPNNGGLTGQVLAKTTAGSAWTNLSALPSPFVTSLANAGIIGASVIASGIAPVPTLKTISSTSPTVTITGNPTDIAVTPNLGGTSSTLTVGNDPRLAFFNTLYVTKDTFPAGSPNYFNTIQAAMAYAATLVPSASNGILIRISPGIFTETSTIVMLPFVIIQGSGYNITTIQPSNPALPAFQGADRACIADLQITNCSSGISYQGTLMADTPLVLSGLNFGNCTTLVSAVNNNPAVITLCLIANCRAGGPFNFTTGFSCVTTGGAYAQLAIVDCQLRDSFSPWPTDCIYCSGVNSSVFVSGSSVRTSGSVGNGIKLSNGAFASVNGFFAAGLRNGLLVDNIGAGPIVRFSGCTMDNNIVNFNVENPLTTGFIDGVFSPSKTFIHPDSTLNYVRGNRYVVNVGVNDFEFSTITSALGYIRPIRNIATTTGSTAVTGTNLDVSMQYAEVFGPGIQPGTTFNYLTTTTGTLSLPATLTATSALTLSKSSAARPWQVIIGPGTFVEPPVTLSSYIAIVGSNDFITTIRAASPGNGALIAQGLNTVAIENMTVEQGAASNTIYVDSSIGIELNDVHIRDSDRGLYVSAVTAPASVSAVNFEVNTDVLGIDIDGTIATSAHAIEVRAEVFNSHSTTGVNVSARGPHIAFAEFNGIIRGGDTGVYTDDGATTILRTTIYDTDIGIHVGNVGAPAFLNAASILQNSLTWDLLLEHPATDGIFNGQANRSKVSVAPTAPISLLYQDSAVNSLTIIGDIYSGATNSTSTNIRRLIEAGTMGLVDGGILTAGVGLQALVSAGLAYIEISSTEIREIIWPNTILALVANTVNYIYIDFTGPMASPTAPTPLALINKICIGFATTSGTSIEILSYFPEYCEHYGNKSNTFNRAAIGPLYSTGSVVSFTGLQIGVSSGRYFLSDNQYTPAGSALPTTIIPYTAGVRGTATTTITNTDYAGGLIPAGEYAKHSLYINTTKTLITGSGIEEYYLVLADATYPLQSDALAAPLALPPPYFMGSIVIIASIIVQEGNPSIVEVRSERPLLGTNVSQIASTTVHGSLLGLAADDHCFSHDTELLTAQGWVDMTTARADDLFMTYNLNTDRCELQRARGIYEYDNFPFLVEFGFAAVTPRHVMVHWDGEQYLTHHAMGLPVANIPTGLPESAFRDSADSTAFRDSAAFIGNTDKSVFSNTITEIFDKFAPEFAKFARISPQDRTYGPNLHKVWCVSVVNRTVFARRQGVVFLCGNTQYILGNGSRAFTGNVDIGGNDIVNVGLVDGVDVPAHASRHLPNGADPITTAAAVTLTATGVNSVGTANSLARSDHIHAISTGTAVSQQPNQINATGTASTLARSDHVHNIPTAAAVTLTAASTNTDGTAATFSRSDHTHLLNLSGFNINNAFTGYPLLVPQGGTGLISAAAGRFLTGNGVGALLTTKVVPTGDVVGTTDIQTLTNKTLTNPIIIDGTATLQFTIPTTGTVATFPAGSYTLATTSTAQSFTNKTITDPSNTVFASGLFSSAGSVQTNTNTPTAGQALIATSASNATWQDITASLLTGIVPIAKGGTNTNTQTTSGITYFDGTSIISGSVLQFLGSEVRQSVNSAIYSGVGTTTTLGVPLASFIGRTSAPSGGMNVYYAGVSQQYLTLDTSGVERLRILATGNVGIGTATPAQTLSVSGTFSATGAVTLSSLGTGFVRSTAGLLSSAALAATDINFFTPTSVIYQGPSGIAGSTDLAWVLASRSLGVGGMPVSRLSLSAPTTISAYSAGILLNIASDITDNTAVAPVGLIALNNIVGSTITASPAKTYPLVSTLVVTDPVEGVGATFTEKYSIYCDSLRTVSLFADSVVTALGTGFVRSTSGVLSASALTTADISTALNYTIGSVLFIGAAQQVSQNNARFFWDNTAWTLGLGTSTNTARVTIAGGPELVVNRQRALAATADVGKDAVITLVGTNNYEIASTASGLFEIFDRTATTSRLALFTNGNIAIGSTTDAGFKLDVNGTFRATSATISGLSDGFVRSTAGLLSAGALTAAEVNTALGLTNNGVVYVASGNLTSIPTNISYNGTSFKINTTGATKTLCIGGGLHVDVVATSGFVGSTNSMVFGAGNAGITSIQTVTNPLGLDLFTANTSRLAIAATGGVNIGNYVAPATALQVNSATDGISVINGATVGARLYSNGIMSLLSGGVVTAQIAASGASFVPGNFTIGGSATITPLGTGFVRSTAGLLSSAALSAADIGGAVAQPANYVIVSAGATLGGSAALQFANGYLGIGGLGSARLHIQGSLSSVAWTNTGIALRVDSAVYTDTTSSGTVATLSNNAISSSVVAATTATTYTDAANLRVGGITAGTNATITNSWAIYADTNTSAAVVTSRNLVAGVVGSTATGALNNITIGPGLSFSAGTLSATSGRVFIAQRIVLTNPTAFTSIIQPTGILGTTTIPLATSTAAMVNLVANVGIVNTNLLLARTITFRIVYNGVAQTPTVAFSVPANSTRVTQLVANYQYLSANASIAWSAIGLTTAMGNSTTQTVSAAIDLQILSSAADVTATVYNVRCELLQ